MNGSVVLFVGSAALIPPGFIGSEFAAQGELVVQLEMEPQTTLYQNNQVTAQVEKMILAHPEVKRVFSNVGFGSSQMSGSSSNYLSEITVVLVDKKERTVGVGEFGNQLKKEIQQLPGVKVKAAATGVTGNANTAPIQVILKGAELDKVQQEAETVLEVTKNVAGTTDVEFSIEAPCSKLQVQIDRERMAALGLNVADTRSSLCTSFSGNDDSKYRESGYEYDINISLNCFNRNSMEDVSNLTFVNNQGQLISLKQFATVTQGVGASKLERKDRMPSIAVNAQVVGCPVGTVGAEIKQAMAGKELPDGVIMEFGVRWSSRVMPSEAF